MADETGNTETILLDAQQPKRVLTEIQNQLKEIKQQVLGLKGNTGKELFGAANNSLKQLEKTIKLVTASATTMNEKLMAGARGANAAFERNMSQAGARARLVERHTKMINDVIKGGGATDQTNKFKNLATATAAYTQQLKLAYKETVRYDAQVASGGTGAATRSLRDNRIARIAGIQVEMKRLAAAEAVETKQAINNAKEIAAAQKLANKEMQIDSNLTFKARQAARRADLADALATQRREMQGASMVMRLRRQMGNLNLPGMAGYIPPEAAQAQTRTVVGTGAINRGETMQQKLVRNASTFANYALIGAGLSGIGAVGSQVVKLDEALHNLQGITQTTDAGMDTLRGTILKVSAASKFATSDLADAATILGQAGLSVAQINDSLGAVTTFAQATGINPEQSVNLLTSAMGAFNMRADETGNLANMLTAALNKSKLTVTQLSQGFQYAANTGAQLGLSANELTTAMAMLANAGIKSGSMIGTGLRQILTRLSAPTTKMKQVLLALNIPLDDIDLKTHGLLGTMKLLQAQGFGAAEALQAFGTRGAAAFIALEGQLKTGEDLQKSITGTNDAAKAAEIQMQSFANVSRNTFAAISAMASTGLDPLLKMLKSLVGGIGDLARGLSELGPVIQLVATSLAAFAGVKLVMYIANILKLGEALNGLRNMVVAFRYIGFAAIFSPVGIAVAAVTTAVVALTYAFTAHSRAIAATAEALDSAKAKYDNTATVAKNLADETQNLLDKQGILKDNSPELANETARLGERFKTLGLDVRGLGTSYDDLLTKMRALRNESLQQQQLALGGLRLAQEQTLRDQQNDYLMQIGRLGGHYGRRVSNTAVNKFFEATFPTTGNPNTNVTEASQAALLKAALAAAADPTMKDLTLVLNKLYEQGQSVLATQKQLSNIGVMQGATTVQSRGSFGAFLTNLQGTVAEIGKSTKDGGTRPEQSGALQRDAVAYAKAIEVWYAEEVAKIKKLNDALTSFAKASPENKAAIDALDLRQSLKDSLGELNERREMANKAAEAQRKVLAKGAEAFNNQFLSNARKELSDAKTVTQANDAYAKIKRYTAQAFSASADQYAASLGLHIGQYTTSGGRINLIGDRFDKSMRSNVAQFNLKTTGAEQGNSEDYNRKIGDLAEQTLRQAQQNDERVARATARGIQASISAYAKQITSEFKTLDKYSPISEVRAHAQAAQEELAQWYIASMDAINKDYQDQLNRLKGGGNADQREALADARQQKIEALEQTRQTMQGNITSKEADLLNNKTGKLANSWSDVWGNVSAAIADPRKTQSFTTAWATSFSDSMVAAATTVKGSFADMWGSIVSNSKTAGQAFSNFARGVLSAMINALSNSVAQQFMQLVGSFLPMAIPGLGTGTASVTGSILSPSVGSISTSSFAQYMPTLAAGGAVPTRDSMLARLQSGGFVLRRSATQALLRRAGGGSVLTAVTPGEGYFSPSAVGAIGMQTLQALNAAGNVRRFASGGALPGLTGAIAGQMGTTADPLGGRLQTAAEKARKKGAGQTNVWVVAPNQQPPMGPQDVVVAISNDIMKNGVTKKLIKTVMHGG